MTLVDTLREHERAWQERAVLRALYREWFERLDIARPSAVVAHYHQHSVESVIRHGALVLPPRALTPKPDHDDPVAYYDRPLTGALYRGRLQLALRLLGGLPDLRAIHRRVTTRSCALPAATTVACRCEAR